MTNDAARREHTATRDAAAMPTAANGPAGSAAATIHHRALVGQSPPATVHRTSRPVRSHGGTNRGSAIVLAHGPGCHDGMRACPGTRHQDYHDRYAGHHSDTGRGMIQCPVWFAGRQRSIGSDMPIGIDISRLATHTRTGTEQYTYELLAAIARIETRQAFRLYAGMTPTSLPPLGDNFTLRVMPSRRLWTHARLSAEILRAPPDVLFVPAHVLPLALPLARRTRGVVTIHDLGYLAFPEHHTRAQRISLALSTRWSAQVAHHVIAISMATRDALIRHLRIDPARISVVHHGVAARFAQPPDDAARERIAALIGTAPYLLCIGTVQPRKNLLRLIDALAATPDAPRLVIVGRRGWLAEPIERRAAELGIADRVRFTGYLADRDLPALYAAATAFVFPSLYEGFGMPVLEAMAAGTPVLTANTSALPEVAGDAAVLVDPGDTAAIAAGLGRISHDSALRQRLSIAGRQRAATFTWEHCAQQTLTILQQVAAH